MSESSTQPSKDLPADFRGLVYRPTCEQEVVALFFLMLPHLGRRIAVDVVREGFPDAEIRELDTAGQWVAKTVEFEMNGANYFRDHEAKKGEKCDIVVCWDTSAEVVPGEPPEMLILSELPEVGRFILYPDRGRARRRVPKIADYVQACAEKGLAYEVQLVEFLQGLAKRFPRHTRLEAGSGDKPCYKFVLRSPPANAVGAEAPGIVYVDWATETSGVANVRPHLAEGYRRKIEPVVRNRGNREWGNIHLSRPDQLTAICDAVEWLVTEAARR